MEYKKHNNSYVLRVDIGEDIVESIKVCCANEKIRLGMINGIGAIGDVTVGVYETATKEYHSVQLKGDYEITSLTGNVTEKDNEVYLHLHISVAGRDYNVKGGHLNRAIVSATAEIVITEIDGTVERRFDDNIGLNLLNFGE